MLLNLASGSLIRYRDLTHTGRGCKAPPALLELNQQTNTNN